MIRHILGYILEPIWWHVFVHSFGFEGRVATDIWLQLSRQAVSAFGTYLATFGADFDECMRILLFGRALPERCLGAGRALPECWPSAGTAEGAKQVLLYKSGIQALSGCS